MKNWLIQALAGTSAIAVCAGTVLGLAAASASFSIIDPNTSRSLSYQDATPIVSAWYNEEYYTVESIPYTTPMNNTSELDHTGYYSMIDRYKYTTVIIDGTTHTFKDKSFNESAYQGEVNWVNDLKWTPDKDEKLPIDAKENIEPKAYDTPSYSGKIAKPDADNIDGFLSSYSQAYKNGAEVLILPGFLHADPVNAFIKREGKNISEGKGMIFIDGIISNPLTPNDKDYDPGYGKNTASVVFRADQAAFMAGIATCMFLEDNYETYKSDGLKVGTYGGIAIPTVTIFMGGLEQGVWYYDENILPKIAVSSGLVAGSQDYLNYIDSHRVEMVSLGELNSYFSGSFSIGDGRLVSQTLLAMGADAIMPVAGPETIDTVAEIKNQNSPAIVIGVDTPQELSDMNQKSDYTDKNGNNDIIKFSAEKNIAGITSQILDLAALGTSAPTKTNVGAFGYMTVGNIENNGVKLSDAGQTYFIKAAQLFNSSITDYQGAVKWFETAIAKIDDSMEFKY